MSSFAKDKAPYDADTFRKRMRDALEAGHGLSKAVQQATAADNAMKVRDTLQGALSRGVPVRDAIAAAAAVSKKS